MFHSRSQKIMDKLITQQRVENVVETIDEFEKQNEDIGLNSEVSDENSILEPKSNSEEPKEFFTLQPLESVPSTSFENTGQATLSNSFSDNEILGISASTLNLIDNCLSKDLTINDIDLSNLTTSDQPSVHNDSNRDPLDNEALINKGYTCYHCSIVFENKKVLRQHISRQHMNLEESESEDDVILNPKETNKQSHQMKKKKTKNENKATTKNKREERKCLRVAGKSYVSVKGKQVKERVKQDFVCTRCPLKCSDKFSSTEKDDLFLGFWRMGEDDKSQDRQRQYVASHIIEVEPERRRVNLSRKKRSLHYYLDKGLERVRVCRSFVIFVFSITEKFIRVCLEKKSDAGIVSADARGKKTSGNKIPVWIEDHARQHIESIPKVESHYCRKTSNKMYLSSQLNLEKLYSLYEEKCQEDNKAIMKENEKFGPGIENPLIRPVSKSQYKTYFYSYGNLRFHKPKKDQCSTCNRYQTLTLEEKEEEKEEYDKHIKNKERVRELKKEKTEESEGSNGKKTVVNFDLQAVLECPKGEVSSIFYKRKLAVYNLTIFDLISKEGTCNLWDETEGNRGSTEIGTCIFNYIKNHPNTEEFFFISDSCGGQNLNQYFSTALLHAVRLTTCNTIDHVFYEPGHSQQEGDSMHSTIERAAKNIQVNVPSEWGIICQTARKTPCPYKILYLNHESFIDWSSLASTNKDTQRYITVTKEVVHWRKIKWFRYLKSEPYSIFFKYGYDDEAFSEIKIMNSIGRPHQLNLQNLPKAYKNRLPITAAKHKDLMDLCKARVIPVHHHHFFEELLKEANATQNKKKPTNGKKVKKETKKK